MGSPGTSELHHRLRMKLSKDKTAFAYNAFLTLEEVCLGSACYMIESRSVDDSIRTCIRSGNE
jgi:hypothetical protein